MNEVLDDLTALQKAFIRGRGYNPTSFGYCRETGQLVAPGLEVNFSWPKKGDSIFTPTEGAPCMNKATAEIRKLLNEASAKAEEFRDSIAEEIDNAGESAGESMLDDLAAAEDLFGNIISAVDSLDEAFPEPKDAAA